MRSEMTIGQYYPGRSILHRLDPRVKLAGTVIFLITVFLMNNLPAFILVTAAMIFCMLASGVPISFMMRGLRPILVIILLTFFMNLFTGGGQTLLFRLGPLTASREGLMLGIRMVLRLSYLVVGASLMTLITTPNQLTSGLETGLRGLNRLRIPVHEIAMMMAIALRFIPILTEEAQRIMKAQKARGADFDSKNLIARVRGLVPLLVPLFVAAIRRADDLSLAMEARCYHGGEGRTKMHPLRYERRDHIAWILLLFYAAVVILLYIFA